MFATRADLLRNSNARRLMQLAIPSDREMPQDVEALRVAIEGGVLTAYSADDQITIALALVVIDGALADADALILSYGIPETVQTTLLARIASTIALYYLQGTEKMNETVQKAFDGVIKLLDGHAKGTLSLIPTVVTVPPEPVGMGAEIGSSPVRYSGGSYNWDFD
jgi:hypothetical protein